MRSLILLIAISQLLFMSCQEQKEHIAPAISPRDSVAMMTSYGVNTMISDSGVMKYRIVAERWEINQTRNPSRWIFDRGIFLEQFDEKFHVEAYIQSDTAYFYDVMKLWELRGRVKVRTLDGLRFSSEELFWDQNKHELYSNMFSRLVTPDRELQGAYFRSDERMTRYMVSNTKGFFIKGDMISRDADTIVSASDTTKQKIRMPATPHSSARTQ